MDGVVKLLLPNNSAAPPLVDVYQSIVSPEPGVALSATVPVEHLELLVPTGVLGIKAAIEIN